MSRFIRIPGTAQVINMDLILSMEVVQDEGAWNVIAYPMGDLSVAVARFESKTDAIEAMMTLTVWGGNANRRPYDISINKEGK